MSAKIFYTRNHVDSFALVSFDKSNPSLKNLEVVDLIILRFTEGSTNNEVIIFKSKNVCVHMKMFT